MKRVIEAEMETRAAKLSTALDRFFKKYPSLDYWRETFEYMAENNEHFFSDFYFDTANRVKNENWAYALHLDRNDNDYYICVIERA